MTGTETTSSKRTSLRFLCHNKPLTYKTAYEEGEARLVNISTSGCAICKATTELIIKQKVLLNLALGYPELQIQIQATVIRAEAPDSFGLQFLHMEESLKHRLIRFFAKENRRHKSHLSSTS